MTNSILEIEDADCIMVIGSNTTEAHPGIAHRVFRAVDKGASLVVVDPRKIQLTEKADIHVRLNYGTDVAFLNGMMHEILKNDWQDKEFIEKRTKGFKELEASLANYPLEKASAISGVPCEIIRETARIYATSNRSTILYTLGITEHSHGVDNVMTLANLAMLTGQIGKLSSGVNPLRGQNNVQGACDMGALPNVYPGYQAVDNQEVKHKFEEAWQTKLPGEIGKTIPEMMDGLIDGTIKGMYIFGENSLAADPDTNHVRHALASAEFLVVQDIFLTETAQLADVVLPGACWAEVDGTFTNTERRVQMIRKAVEPPGQAMPNWKIFCEIGNRLGLSMNYNCAQDIFDEMATLTPSFSGITYNRIDSTPIHWPCTSLDHPGTKFLHQGKFSKGRGLFHAVEFKRSEEMPDEDYPFILTTGRRYAHYNTSTMTGRCASLDRDFPTPVAQVNFQDADTLQVKHGESIKVSSRRGEVIIPIAVGDVVPKGSIFMDFHFCKANSNQLLGTFLDPVSKTPDYKCCAVKLEPYTGPENSTRQSEERRNAEVREKETEEVF